MLSSTSLLLPTAQGLSTMNILYPRLFESAPLVFLVSLFFFYRALGLHCLSQPTPCHRIDSQQSFARRCCPSSIDQAQLFALLGNTNVVSLLSKYLSSFGRRKFSGDHRAEVQRQGACKQDSLGASKSKNEWLVPSSKRNREPSMSVVLLLQEVEGVTTRLCVQDSPHVQDGCSKGEVPPSVQHDHLPLNTSSTLCNSGLVRLPLEWSLLESGVERRSSSVEEEVQRQAITHTHANQVLPVTA